MTDIRAEITGDVQKIVARHDLHLRGSWLYGEQHFVAVENRLFSLSDIDIISDRELATPSEELVRTDIKAATENILLFPPAISIRNVAISNDASQVINHNTLFWAYIALFELKNSLQESQPNTYCDTESYFLNKFLLNIWRNLLFEAGKSPTSYSSIVDALDDLPDHDKKGILLIKKGEYRSREAPSLISKFHDYTAAWVKENSRNEIRSGLLDILVGEAHRRDFSLIFSELSQVAITGTEFDVIAYSQARIGRVGRRKKL